EWPTDARHRRRLPAVRIRAVRHRHRAEPRDDRGVLRHPRPGLQPGFLQLPGQALPDAGHAYPRPPGAEPAADLRRRPHPGDVPVPDAPPLDTIYDNLLIGDVDTVAQKLVAEVHATKPVHVCFSFKVGNTPHKAAMRSMELMIGEVKPKVERALAP